MYCKREICLTVCCVLSVRLMSGATDSKEVNAHPADDTIRNGHSRINLARTKTGWIGGDDPGIRAALWTKTTIPPQTNPPPRPGDTAKTTPLVTTEPPPTESLTTKLTTGQTIHITPSKTTPITVKCTSTRRVYTSKMTMSTTTVPSTKSASTTVHGRFISVVVVLLVWSKCL